MINPVALLPWMNMAFVPVALGTVTTRHRVIAIAFVLLGVLSLWLEVETLRALGFPHGFTHLFDLPIEARGAITYCVSNGVYLLFLHRLRTRPVALLLPFSIALYFGTVTLSTLFMIL